MGGGWFYFCMQSAFTGMGSDLAQSILHSCWEASWSSSRNICIHLSGVGWKHQSLFFQKVWTLPGTDARILDKWPLKLQQLQFWDCNSSWWSPSPAYTKPCISSPALRTPGSGVHTYNPIIWDIKAGSQDLGRHYSHLHTKLETSIRQMRPCIKRQKPKY